VRAALVTGAASGIGAAIGERLRADGWSVHAVDIRGDVDQLADLTTSDGNRAAVDTAVERFGRLDAVIPNAGFQHVAPIAEFPEEQWNALLALMLTSPFLLARAAWPWLMASGEGRFVPIASVHGLRASPFKAGYVAAKHGLLGLVKTLALEGADVGVSAMAVCPAYVRTPLVEAQIADQAMVHDLPADQVLRDVILASQPVKRLVEPEEVAATVAFLLGPEGRSFTGSPVVMGQAWPAR
jgi:3-hydroxybutyrate dehydrogenase